jgi:hypothetical protein
MGLSFTPRIASKHLQKNDFIGSQLLFSYVIEVDIYFESDRRIAAMTTTEFAISLIIPCLMAALAIAKYYGWL